MDEQMLDVTEEVKEELTKVDEVKFNTLRFGEITVPEERIFSFPKGLVGMSDACRFTFVHQEDLEGPFFWMQAIDDPALAFVVCDPHSFFPNYTVPLSREEQSLLSIQDPKEGIVCVILVVPSDPREITANLKGPVIVNVEKGIGYQAVLNGEEFPTRANLFNNPEQDGGAKCSS